MIKQNRPNAPKWLTSRYKKWGLAFAERRQSDPNAQFNWPKYNTKKINQLLVPILQKMTKEHCSFCDAFPMGSTIPTTIEHFKPKSQYPKLACEWKNLYLCCGNCQQKGDEYSILLLRPDAVTYTFDKYFVFNYRTGELETNPAASLLD